MEASLLQAVDPGRRLRRLLRQEAAPATAAPIVEHTGIGRRYGAGGVAVIALEAVDLVVRPGEFVVVLGPSGSGKTTLLNLIGGLDVARSGTISVAGHQLSGASRRHLVPGALRLVE